MEEVVADPAGGIRQPAKLNHRRRTGGRGSPEAAGENTPWAAGEEGGDLPAADNNLHQGEEGLAAQDEAAGDPDKKYLDKKWPSLMAWSLFFMWAKAQGPALNPPARLGLEGGPWGHQRRAPPAPPGPPLRLLLGALLLAGGGHRGRALPVPAAAGLRGPGPGRREAVHGGSPRVLLRGAGGRELRGRRFRRGLARRGGGVPDGRAGRGRRRGVRREEGGGACCQGREAVSWLKLN
ncbi:unnamed protein product [Urochloa humidicola]